MGGGESTVAAAVGILSMRLTARGDDLAFIFTSIDVPGAIATNALGVNAGGGIVGFYRDASNRQHGFVLDRRGFRTLDYPGATVTEARGISPNGEVVGAYRMPGEPLENVHGYRLTRSGEYVPIADPGHISAIAHHEALDFPGAAATRAFGVNARGDVVGSYVDASGWTHGFHARRMVAED